MDFDSVGEIIASRMLHVIDEDGNKRPVSVFVGRPEPSRDQTGYECPYQIIGIGSQKAYAGRGRDSIQALQDALTLLGQHLNTLSDELGGQLIWDGGAPGELGFS